MLPLKIYVDKDFTCRFALYTSIAPRDLWTRSAYFGKPEQHSGISQAPRSIGDNAVTSSIRTAQVFPKLVGKRTHAALKVCRGMLKYMINYVLHLAQYDAYFHINDDAKKCRYLFSVTNNFIFFYNSF